MALQLPMWLPAGIWKPWEGPPWPCPWFSHWFSHWLSPMEFLCFYRPSARTFLVLCKGNIGTNLKCLCGLCCRAQITSQTCIISAGKPKTGSMAVLRKQRFSIIREKSKRQSAKCTIPNYLCAEIEQGSEDTKHLLELLLGKMLCYSFHQLHPDLINSFFLFYHCSMDNIWRGTTVPLSSTLWVHALIN